MTCSGFLVGSLLGRKKVPSNIVSAWAPVAENSIVKSRDGEVRGHSLDCPKWSGFLSCKTCIISAGLATRLHAVHVLGFSSGSAGTNTCVKPPSLLKCLALIFNFVQLHDDIQHDVGHPSGYVFYSGLQFHSTTSTPSYGPPSIQTSFQSPIQPGAGQL